MRLPFPLLLFVVGAFGLGVPGAGAEQRPNVVFILIDDLGWSDLGCYGSTFYETPHVDRLAGQGMRFTDAYAACNCCSPTRASIMTGKYPARLHLTDWIPGTDYPWAKLRPPQWRKQLALEEVTLAEALRSAGYATAAVGKWHMGGENYRPEQQGFALNFAGDSRGAPPSYFWPYKIPGIAEGQAGEYLTDRLTSEALKFLETNRDRPLFLYLAHYAVHTPLQGKEAIVAKYRAKVKPGQAQNNPVYAAMIESVDQNVGRLLAKLDELGLTKRTVVVLTSDNGGYRNATSNAPLRAAKGTPWEGGHRVPLIVRWPGLVSAQSTCREPVCSVDFYPTILQIAGVPGDPHHNAQIDGVSLLPLLRQTGRLPRDALYWHYPHYNTHGGRPYGAARQGDFKLIEFYEDGQLELYNLRDDPGETTNLADQMPDLAASLRQKLHQWRTATGAQMPEANADYDPARADRWAGQAAKPARKR